MLQTSGLPGRRPRPAPATHLRRRPLSRASRPPAAVDAPGPAPDPRPPCPPPARAPRPPAAPPARSPPAPSAPRAPSRQPTCPAGRTPARSPPAAPTPSAPRVPLHAAHLRHGLPPPPAFPRSPLSSEDALLPAAPAQI
ncbi:uncharacterized protein [Bos mutus]|uniref:uncharacterized protein n=1 Tax=Bos mutus TaxID=72004 RepID=UPI0038B51E07